MNSELREIIELINTAQNTNNSFVNFSLEDANKVYEHVKKHDLDTDETIQLIVDLGFV